MKIFRDSLVLSSTLLDAAEASSRLKWMFIDRLKLENSSDQVKLFDWKSVEILKQWKPKNNLNRDKLLLVIRG